MKKSRETVENIPVFKKDDFWIKYNVINLLNSFPIYEYFDNKKREKELIICSNTILSEQTSLFINYALQFCQSDHYSIKIIVLTSNPEKTKKEFLEDKPAISKFINIDQNKVEDSLGTINFENLDKLKEVLKKTNCRYYFVSFRNPEENDKIAEQIYKTNDNNLVFSDHDSGNVFYINEKQDFDKTLSDLALNLHLSYKNKNYLNAGEVYEEFLQEYNFLSSLLGVVSIFYKLNSIGINPEKDPEEFYKTLNSFEEVKDEVADELAYIEHKRWLIEKIFDGYDSFKEEDFNRIIDENRTHFEDNNRKIHFCVVSSKKNFPLEKTLKTDWDNPLPKEKSFDNLDKISLKVHRILKEEAQKRKEKKSELDKILDRIGNNIENSTNEVKNNFNLFRQYYDRLLNLNDSQAYINLIDSYKTLKATRKLNENDLNNLEKITNFLEPINRYLNPIDYKNYDKEIINNISYIFKNRFREKLGLGFQIESNSSERYQNVASLTVLFPKEVVYFSYLTQNKELRTLYQHFINLADYIKRRIPDCYIEINIFLSSKISQDSIDELESSLINSQDDLNNFNFNIHIVESTEEAQDKIKEIIKIEDIKVIDARTRIFGNNSTDMNFKRDLRDEGIPQFRYNPKNSNFDYMENCSYLKFLKTDNFIINLYDIFQIGNAIMYFTIPKYTDDDIKFLWELVTGFKVGEYITDRNKYEKNITHWNDLSRRLKDFDERKIRDSYSGLRVQLSLPVKSKVNKVKNDYIKIKNDIKTTFLYLCDYLRKEGYLLSKPKIIKVSDNETSYLLETKIPDLVDKLNNLIERFSSKMRNRDRINIYTTDSSFGENEIFNIVYNDLEVYRFELENSESHWIETKKIKNILKQLNNKGFIGNLKFDSNFAYFNFKDIFNKDLILTSGKVLELYCYMLLKNSRIFNEVSTGVEIENKETKEKNEFDLIAIKGKKAFIIECKQTKKLKQDYVYKLRSLSLDYNINSHGILIANNYAKGKNIKRENEINKRRAERDKINVINEPNDIVNLVDTIKNFI